MKKSFAKKLGVCLVVILCVQLCPTYASDLPVSDFQIRQMMAEQERAVAANDAILNGMGVLPDGRIDYEDDFAGTRIENNKLIISLTNCSDSARIKYLTWVSEYLDIIIFEEVDYSYNYLSSKVDDVTDTLYTRTGESVLGYYISEVNNSIVLKIDEETQNILNKQRSNITYDVPVEYELGDETEFISAEIRGGDTIINLESGSCVSVGCCGYFRGALSIATCGHGSYGVGDLFVGEDITQGRIGTVVYHNFNNGRYGDYAILSGASSDYTYTNKIGSTYNITGVITNPPVGTYVYFYGQATQKYCLGIVDERWVSCTVEDDSDGDGIIETITIGDLNGVQILEWTVNPGDSGGTVFTVSLGTTNASFAGVMSVREENLHTGEVRMYFSPASFFTAAGFSVKTS